MEQRAQALQGRVFLVRGSRGAANGFVVEADTLVTVAQILGDEAEVVLVDAAGVQREGVVLGRDELANLAVIQVADLGVEPPSFSQEAPPLQAPMVAVGYRAGAIPTFAPATGLVSATGIQREGFLYFLVVSVPALPPDLVGAPLMDEQGRVVGMYTATLAGEDQPGAVLSLPSILSWLPRLKAGAVRLLPKGCAPGSPGAPPPLPSIFQGRVLVNGSPAPAGTQLYARVVLGTQECWAPATLVDADGRYVLAVGAPSPGWQGARVEFFIDGWRSPISATFIPNRQQTLDLQLPPLP